MIINFFIKQHIKNNHIPNEDQTIKKIVHRHNYVVELMALGIMEYKESLDPKGLTRNQSRSFNQNVCKSELNDP